MIYIWISDVSQVDPIDAAEVLKKGDVILVRSDYEHEKYGDHFALIVGGKIQKERGVRPNLITFPPLIGLPLNDLLDQFHPIDGAILLKLSDEKAAEFLSNMQMHLSKGAVTIL